METPSQSPAKIRIALVITELEVGGAERCLVNLAQGLNGDRFDPVVYSLADRPADGRDELVQELENRQIPVQFIGAHSKIQLWSAIRKLKNELLRQSPHLLQSFLFHANITSCLARKLARVPILLTGVRVADPSRCRHWLERRLAGRADKIVCVSDAVQDFCRTQAKLPADKLVTIPNGIDISRFAAQSSTSPSEFGIPDESHVIGYVGRLHVQKGLDWLLEVAPKIVAALPQAHFLFVGEGPQRASLQDQAARLGMNERIHFTGFRSDVPRILSACSVVVLPSRWEGMPNVILEAMAAGIPVVAAKAHGVAQLLGPRAASQSVNFGDSDDLADKIVQLCKDKLLASELGQANRHRAADHFSLDRMIAEYTALYDSLLAQKNDR